MKTFIKIFVILMLQTDILNLYNLYYITENTKTSKNVELHLKEVL